ncbi:MAG: hypothetical protein IH965_12950 [Gemmatimonadetes bacterium]|nr:hypothetical protein [Gemmatimonadota bacterium]
MSPRIPLFVVTTLCLAGCSTIGQMVETVELKTDLENRYDGTDVELAWVNGLDHLEVTLDGPSFRALPDSAIPALAMEVAHVALAHFPEARRPDSVTVSLIRERSGGMMFLKRTQYVSVTLAASEVR